MPDIQAKSWSRFVTTNLEVAAELMGQAHTFDFEKHSITVRLPNAEDAGLESFDRSANVRATLVGTEIPSAFRVFKVDLEINVSDFISVPEEALSKPCNQFDFFSQDQKNNVTDLVAYHSLLAERAFDYWLGIIRWASGNGLVGQPKIGNFKSGELTYIRDASTNRNVWSDITRISLIIGKTWIEEACWERANYHLKIGDELPLHIRFLHDAEASAWNGHFKKSILELAMACEVYLRYSVFEFIPKDTPQELKSYIEEANINQYSTKFFKNLVPEIHQKEYAKLTKEISSLMSKRNSYVHLGKMKEANSAMCHRFINVMKKLFEIRLNNEKLQITNK